MSTRLISCSIAVLITALSSLGAMVAFRRLHSEEQRNKSTYLDVSFGTNRYVVRQRDGKCFGAITVELLKEDNQFSLKVAGWGSFRFNGTLWTQEILGDVAFNPLGQAGGSVFKTTVNNNELRIGTININPITLIVSSPKSNGKSDVKFQQNIPGPVEIRRLEGTVYRISAPPTTLALPPALVGSKALDLPLVIERTENDSCTRESATPFDLREVFERLLKLKDQLGPVIAGLNV